MTGKNLEISVLCDIYSALLPEKQRLALEYYYDDAITSFSRNGESTPQNFVISPDGSAVAYTIKNKNDSSIDDLYVYTIDQASPESRSAGKVSTVPVSISNGGADLLAYITDGETKYLYHIVGTERYRINDLVGTFNAVTATNSTGTEIVFTTKADTEYHSYIYDFEKLDKEANTAVYFGPGYSIPQAVDSEVVYKATFKKSYFQNLSSKVTFHIDRKYKPKAISTALGQFSPDMKYFYCINEEMLAFLHCAHFLAIQPISALVGIVQQSQYVQQGGLAASAGSHDGDKIAFLHLQADAVQRHGLHFLGTERPYNVFCLDHLFSVFFNRVNVQQTAGHAMFTWAKIGLYFHSVPRGREH